ncbi:MAG: type II toxin-antitoxin system VapB family antitoxin [Novosphingobium sp.]
MRTTITIDDALLAKAREYTGCKETSTLVRLGLEELAQTEVAKRIIAMGGTVPDAWAPNEGDDASPRHGPHDPSGQQYLDRSPSSPG